MLTKSKKNQIVSCQSCLKFPSCQTLCRQARKFVLRDETFEFARFVPQNRKTCRLAIDGRCSSNKCRRCPHYVASEKIKTSAEDLSGETNPEAALNEPIDNKFLYSTDIRETFSLLITGTCDDPEVAETYRADLIDNFNKIKRTKSRTPSWAYRYPKNLWALYDYFRRGKGIREIARTFELSPGYVSKIIGKHRRVLENHLEKVFPIGTRRTYFYEKYFNQLTVTQIAEKYNVSHQSVSKSIRRTRKKIKKSLLKTVAFRQRLRMGFLFSQDGNKNFLTSEKILLLKPIN